MSGNISVLGGIGGNGYKAYLCNSCDHLITYSDRHVAIVGTRRHFFVNPAGIECELYSFIACPGAVAYGQGTEEHTWFSGYQWRLALCGRCFRHLGWHYEAVSRLARPIEFWGILVSHLKIK